MIDIVCSIPEKQNYKIIFTFYNDEPSYCSIKRYFVDNEKPVCVSYFRFISKNKIEWRSEDDNNNSIIIIKLQVENLLQRILKQKAFL